MQRRASDKRPIINTRAIVYSAFLVATGIILSFVQVPVTPIVEITFTGIPIALGGYFLGPWIGFIIGALIDFCGFMAAPKGTFFVGFTLSSGLVGLIYGLVLYRRWWDSDLLKNQRRLTSSPIPRGMAGLSLPARVVLGHLLKTVLISLLLNCLWLSIFYGMPFIAVFLGSLPKEAINFPIEAFLIYVLIRRLRTIKELNQI